MARNLIGCDRGQELLLPPNRAEWLPEDHFVWFVPAAFEEIDLAASDAAYRVHGQAVRNRG